MNVFEELLRKAMALPRLESLKTAPPKPRPDTCPHCGQKMPKTPKGEITEKDSWFMNH